MGDIIDNIKAASNGTPYSGDRNISNQTEKQEGSEPIIGSPIILKHSLDSNPIISKPISLNENADNN